MYIAKSIPMWFHYKVIGDSLLAVSLSKQDRVIIYYLSICGQQDRLKKEASVEEDYWGGGEK